MMNDKPFSDAFAAIPRSDTLANSAHSDRMAFRFLDLPGELRNRIYHFAVKPSCGIPQSGNGVAIGLTQVCRQIRSEFRSKYLRESKIGVPSTHIARYIDVFYPAVNCQNVEEVQDYPTHIYVLLSIPEAVSEDLLPLVKIKIAHPQLQFSVILDSDKQKSRGFGRNTCATVQRFLNGLSPGIVHDISAMELSKIDCSWDAAMYFWYKSNTPPYGQQLSQEDDGFSYVQFRAMLSPNRPATSIYCAPARKL